MKTENNTFRNKKGLGNSFCSLCVVDGQKAEREDFIKWLRNGKQHLEDGDINMYKFFDGKIKELKKEVLKK